MEEEIWKIETEDKEKEMTVKLNTNKMVWERNDRW